MNAVTNKLPPAQLTYLGNASASPQMEEFTGAQAGQSVCYWLRGVKRAAKKAPKANSSLPPSPGKYVGAKVASLKYKTEMKINFARCPAPNAYRRLLPASQWSDVVRIPVVG